MSIDRPTFATTRVRTGCATAEVDAIVPVESASTRWLVPLLTVAVLAALLHVSFA